MNDKTEHAMTTDDLPKHWIRKRDGMHAEIIEHTGGAYDWIKIRLSSGKAVTISASGLRSKYVQDNER